MIKTNDIYLASYLKTCGLSFKGAERNTDPDSGKSMVTLSFEGISPELEAEYQSQFEKDYTVHVQQYLTNLFYIRSVVYKVSGSRKKTYEDYSK
jgi:hypothetical protein